MSSPKWIDGHTTWACSVALHWQCALLLCGGTKLLLEFQWSWHTLVLFHELLRWMMKFWALITWKLALWAHNGLLSSLQAVLLAQFVPQTESAVIKTCNKTVSYFLEVAAIESGTFGTPASNAPLRSIACDFHHDLPCCWAVRPFCSGSLSSVFPASTACACSWRTKRHRLIR